MSRLMSGDPVVSLSEINSRIWSALLMTGLLLLLPACDSGKTNLPPSADFTFTPETPRAGASVQFTAKPGDPEGKIDNLIWHFRQQEGDYEERTTGKTPTHTFPQKGEYNVQLTVRDNIGSTDTTTKAISVRYRYSRVTIQDTVQISTLPYRTASDGEDTQDDGQDWPKDGDPALYYRLSDSTGTLYESNVKVYEDSTFIPKQDLPVVFENVSFSPPSLSSTYVFSLYEADSSSADDLIQTIDFSFAPNVACNVNAATCYPDIKALTAPPGVKPENANTLVYLYLNWQK